MASLHLEAIFLTVKGSIMNHYLKIAITAVVAVAIAKRLPVIGNLV